MKQKLSEYEMEFLSDKDDDEGRDYDRDDEDNDAWFDPEELHDPEETAEVEH